MKNKISTIEIKGARTHNLQNIDISIPKNTLVVVTGVSGSGKSSLSIHTLFAEGQRRYVESLSAYARQFLNRMNKPDVDYIQGLSPAIAIKQKVSTRTTRSTVGTLTEIYDYLRLLYARLGRTFSPISGKEVKRHQVSDVVDYICELKQGSKIELFFEFKEITETTLLDLLEKGYTRIQLKNRICFIEDLIEKKVSIQNAIKVLVDRLVIKEINDALKKRIANSVQICFNQSKACWVNEIGKGMTYFNHSFELDGLTFDYPSPHFFNFNSSLGACQVCEGFGTTISISKDLVFPDKTLSIFEGAIAPWRGAKTGLWLKPLIDQAAQFDFPIHRPYEQLNEKQKEILWTGNTYFKGLNDFFKYIAQQKYKIQYRVLESKYKGRNVCPSCKGTRIRKEAQYVKIAHTSIEELLLMPIDNLFDFFSTIRLSKTEQIIAKQILVEIKNRVQFMQDVGLGYLTLNRLSNTLSGGETQRINLTRSLGSNLTSSLYILDEPSIGLHPKDTHRLILTLQKLRDLGNTVLVVEHDEDMILAADHLIDMGPLAGKKGGKVIFNGPAEEIRQCKESLTAKYLQNIASIGMPKTIRKGINYITVRGAKAHNLKHIDVKFPLEALTIVTGVSGSGKTTLVKKILYPALSNLFSETKREVASVKAVDGDTAMISQVIFVNQNPIGKSSRSNPVTYVKAYDAIRTCFTEQDLSKKRKYKPKIFSFNVDGGRCDTCKGEGETVVEMQFLADVHLTCESCKGKRFKKEVLDIKYKDKNISEVLEMTIDEAIVFFQEEKEIIRRLKPLQDVGLGYIMLGQSSNTLSGGEAQRVKLASFLIKGNTSKPVLFIFDEPTTGLHFYDVEKLLTSLNALINCGHTVVVIEHHLDVIKNADWLIDLGPKGGDKGGQLIYQGIPKGILTQEHSLTGQYLKKHIGQ